MPEDVRVEITDKVSEGKLGDAIGVAAVGLAAYGTVCLGKQIFGGAKKLINKIAPVKEEEETEEDETESIKKEDVQVEKKKK